MWSRCQQTRALDRPAHRLSFNSRPCPKTHIRCGIFCLHPRSSLGTAGTDINKEALPPTSAGATHPLPRFPHRSPQVQELPRTDPPTPTYPWPRCEPEPLPRLSERNPSLPVDTAAAARCGRKRSDHGSLPACALTGYICKLIIWSVGHVLINYLSILCDSARHETKQTWEGRVWHRAAEEPANLSPTTRDYLHLPAGGRAFWHWKSWSMLNKTGQRRPRVLCS